MIGISDILNRDDSTNDRTRHDPPFLSNQATSSSSSLDSASSVDSLMSNKSSSELSTPSSVSASSTELPTQKSTAKSTPTNEPRTYLNGNEQISTIALSKPIINKRFLVNKNFVKLAIRRKSASKKNLTRHHLEKAKSQSDFDKSSSVFSNVSEDCVPLNSNSKLHVKSLEAGLKVKLSLATNLLSLYHSLIPFTNKREIYSVYRGSSFEAFDAKTPGSSSNSIQSSNFAKRAIVSKSVKLIDNNLVDLAGFSNKILQSFNLVEHNGTETIKSEKDEHRKNSFSSTFNSLDTAVHTLFGINEYSLIRVTRSTSDDLDGSVVLKMETAHTGDSKLIDDVDFMEEMIYSLGTKGSVPSNLFIKKIVARPRYKSDMKIYLIPHKISCALYTDERMFERDLINGIIEINEDEDPNNLSRPLTDTSGREVYVTFPFAHIIREFKYLRRLSKQLETSCSESDMSGPESQIYDSVSPHSSLPSSVSCSAQSSQPASRLSYGGTPRPDNEFAVPAPVAAPPPPMSSDARILPPINFYTSNPQVRTSHFLQSQSLQIPLSTDSLHTELLHPAPNTPPTSLVITPKLMHLPIAPAVMELPETRFNTLPPLERPSSNYSSPLKLSSLLNNNDEKEKRL